MNRHLNLFHFFNEDDNQESIENNLSRALSLCLMNDRVFFAEFIREIVSEQHFKYLFDSYSEGDIFSIDIQVNTENIDVDSFDVVYPIAMTADSSLRMDDFFQLQVSGDKKSITDIFISVKDIAFVIEVKRTDEDCKRQLHQQILPFVKQNGGANIHDGIHPKRFSWPEVLKLMERVENIHRLSTHRSPYISDFLELSESKYPWWFEPKPFNDIPFMEQNRSSGHTPLMKRMRQALSGVSEIKGSEYELLNYPDRMALSVPFGWAAEVIPGFETDKSDSKDYVTFYIWPGNTKRQGERIFDKPLDWTRKTSLSISGYSYDLEISYEAKLCHFNGHVTSIFFSNQDLRRALVTNDNFYQASGKWDRTHLDKWQKRNVPDFEEFLDLHFKPEFNWREKCQWNKHFPDSNRKYLTMALGFQVGVYIPYDIFQQMDKRQEDVAQVSGFIGQILEAFEQLIH